MNKQVGYGVPIIAILCDGRIIFFYRFIDKCCENSPRPFLGEFPDSSKYWLYVCGWCRRSASGKTEGAGTWKGFNLGWHKVTVLPGKALEESFAKWIMAITWRRIFCRIFLKKITIQKWKNITLRRSARIQPAINTILKWMEASKPVLNYGKWNLKSMSTSSGIFP